MSKTVTLADGSRVNVTPENWNEMAALQIEAKQAAGQTLNFQEKSATVTAFRTLAGLTNGFFDVRNDGAAAPRSMGEEAILNQGTVRLSDRIMGLPVAGGSIVGDVSAAGLELGRNYGNKVADVTEAAAGNAKRAGLALVYGAADWWKDAKDGVANLIPGGGVIATIAVAGAVVAVAFVGYKLVK
jgi:hypothetical protein